jgi:hypothetical protein
MAGGALGTLGFFFAAFGNGTYCTDFNEAPGACDALNRWLAAGFIGQWVLVVVAAALLTIGLRWPRSRPKVAVSGWVTVAATIGWYAFYFYGAWHSYKVHS